jgi:hypothetical protein
LPLLAQPSVTSRPIVACAKCLPRDIARARFWRVTFDLAGKSGYFIINDLSGETA